MNNIEQPHYSYIKLLIISLLLTFSIFSLHAQQFQLHYINELVPENIGTDSTLTILKNKTEKATINQDKSTVIKCLLASSSFNRYKLDFNAAFDYAGKALILAEEYDAPELQARAHENFGVLNFIFFQYDLAGEHFNQSFQYYEEAYEKGLIAKSDLFYPNYNLLLYNRRIKNKTQIKYHLEACSEILKTTDIDPTYQIYIDLDKEGRLRAANQFKEAETLLLSSIKKVENIKENSESYPYNHNLLLTLYARTARLFEKEGDEKLAGIYFKKAIESIELNGNQAFFIVYVHVAYAAWLFRQGDYYNAYLHNNKARNLNDRYQGARRVSNKGFLSVRDNYSEELQKKNEEINRQSLELAENKQEILRTRIILVILLFLVIIAAIVIRNRIRYLKQQKEKELSQSREQEAKELLAHRNRELTANMLQLIEKDEMFSSVRAYLKNGNDGLKTIKYLDSLKKQSISLWDAFNSRFADQNKDFYDRLQKRVPNLSSNDLKICALIKLNFSTKEMAILLGISTGSLHVARHRLRKKMDIERDVNLFDFINSI